MNRFSSFVGFLFLSLLLSCHALELNSTDGSWTKSKTPANNWLSHASDANGKNLIAVTSTDGPSSSGVYISHDYGATWTNVMVNGAPIGYYWVAVAIDSYGSRYFALQQDYGLHYSTDGKYWNHYRVDPTATYMPYSSMAVSGDGMTVYVTASGGNIYVSRNAGYSFTATSAPKISWFSMGTNSATGQYAIAVGSKSIYYTANYGSSWTKAASAPSLDYYQVHLSADGKYAYAAAVASDIYGTTGGIFNSSSYGQNWVISMSTDRYLPWRAVTSDYSGQRVAAAVSTGDVYYSTDYGNTFQKSANAPSGEYWKSITCDVNNFKYCTLVSGNGGNIYYSSTGI